ncbi:hypothetical protein AKJ09_06584 [Labilithrix luteola]|uniref:Uncharacterized protein n=1 Tax=Labilithrix luteola TaxID=1391654 RepID=A0A0K1Q284_9BACT|nr:hypothetical protein [Labilithrix luteola]AKU99920.1 hypothetical protein AKJ09_06584 [Labilithrix luteola]
MKRALARAQGLFARGAMVGLFASVATTNLACGGSTPAPVKPPPTPLHLAPACDLAPAAGLEWIVAVTPRAIADVPDLIPTIARVVPEERFASFAAAHGGIDLRRADDLCVARYRRGGAEKSSTLSIVHGPIDPARLEKAFGERSSNNVERTITSQDPLVVRLAGSLDGERRELGLFGRELVVSSEGSPALFHAAEAFAFGKLKRAQPALRGAALGRAAEVLGNAPVRVFFPGPFEGDTGKGLGGLLRASTAVATSASFGGAPSKINVRLVLVGAWGSDASSAAERLAAAIHVVSESGLGQLFGLHRPVTAPSVKATDDALILDATIDGMALARGLHDALDAEVTEIMGR